MTFQVLTDDTRTVITRSVLRLAPDGENNLKLDSAKPEELPERLFLKPKPLDKGRMPIVDASSQPFSVAYDDDPDDTKEDPDLPSALRASTVTAVMDVPLVTGKGEEGTSSSPPSVDELLHKDDDAYDSDGDPIPDLTERRGYDSDEDSPRITTQ